MKKGFTLLEIVIVIAVMGILLAVLLPNWSAIFGKTDNATALAEAQTVANELLSVLLGEHSDDAADFVIFIRKGSGIFTYGYDASQTKLLQCRIVAEGADLSDRTKTVEPLLKAGALTLAEGNDRFLWRMPARFDTTVEKVVRENGIDAADIRVYAVYEILPVNFDAEAQRPGDCAHTNKKNLSESAATCSFEGCGACFVCTDCGALFESETSAETTERAVTSVDADNHKWFYTQLDGTQHKKYCEYCTKSELENCDSSENCDKCRQSIPTQNSFSFEGGLLYRNGQLFTGLNESDLGEHGLYYFEGSLAQGSLAEGSFFEGRLTVSASAEKLEPSGYLLRVQNEGISPRTRELLYRFPLFESTNTLATYAISAENCTVLGLRLSGLESDPLFAEPWTQATLEAYCTQLRTAYSTQYTLEDSLSVPHTDDYTAWKNQTELSYNDFIRYKYGAFLHCTKDGFLQTYLERDGKKYAAYAYLPQNGASGLVIYSSNGSSLRAAIWTTEKTSTTYKRISSGDNILEDWTLTYDSGTNSLTVAGPGGISDTFTFYSSAFSGDLSSVSFATPEREALFAYAVLPAGEEKYSVGKVGENPTVLEYLHRALWQGCTLCSCADGTHAKANHFLNSDTPQTVGDFHLYCYLVRFADRFASAPPLWPSADLLVTQE